MKTVRHNFFPVALSLMLLALMVLGSCSMEVKQERSTGKTNEILVVTNTKEMWEGEVGTVVREYFEQSLPGLPQPEPMFRLFNVAEADFNKLFKAMHNILIIDIDPTFKQPLVETRRDHWSKPQRLIKITAPDFDSFKNTFDEHKTAFLKAFDELEIIRTNEQFEMAKSVKMINHIREKFGFSMQIPGGFEVASENDHFIWIKQGMHKVKQDVELGIFIYEEPYHDTIVFKPDRILDLRDSLTAIHIAGPSKGSYMAISKGIIDPVFSLKDGFPSPYAIETRGLWMVRNDFMGGPFISYTFVDPKLEKLFTVDAYVYNPGDIKRNFIRQMEAIINSIKFED